MFINVYDQNTSMKNQLVSEDYTYQHVILLGGNHLTEESKTESAFLFTSKILTYF